MGRALLDGGADIDEIIGEYFSAAYGAAAPQALAFLEELSALSRCDYVNGKGPRQDPDMARRMDRAQALCRAFAVPAPGPADGPVQAGFLTRLGYHAQYAGRLAAALAALARGDGQAGARWDELCRFIGQGETAFQPWLDVYRVIDVTHNYTGF